MGGDSPSKQATILTVANELFFPFPHDVHHYRGMPTNVAGMSALVLILSV
jgi:hypothetical protein